MHPHVEVYEEMCLKCLTTHALAPIHARTLELASVGIRANGPLDQLIRYSYEDNLDSIPSPIHPSKSKTPSLPHQLIDPRRFIQPPLYLTITAIPKPNRDPIVQNLIQVPFIEIPKVQNHHSQTCKPITLPNPSLPNIQTPSAPVIAN